jgi:hypothetical protein
MLLLPRPKKCIEVFSLLSSMLLHCYRPYQNAGQESNLGAGALLVAADVLTSSLRHSPIISPMTYPTQLRHLPTEIHDTHLNYSTPYIALPNPT